MKNCYHYCHANYDIQPAPDPYGMVQYILAYVTKTQNNMRVLMERACAEAKKGKMHIKSSVCHIGNVFLNALETSQQEAVCQLLQIPITHASCDVLFFHTAHPNEHRYLLKTYDKLKSMDHESANIESHNLLTEYQSCPHTLENYLLAKFASLFRHSVSKRYHISRSF